MVTMKRKYDAFSLFALSILFIVIVYIFSMIYYATIETSFDNFINTLFSADDFINTLFSAFLVLITYLYTSFTKDILKDGKKKREIEFIQRQLEYFYYPLLRIMEKAERIEKVVSESLGYEIYANETADCSWLKHNFDYKVIVAMLAGLKENNIGELYKYKYLSSVNVREKFQKIEQYLEYIDDELLEGEDEFLEDNQKQIYTELKSFKEELESEIKEINNKLINLIN